MYLFLLEPQNIIIQDHDQGQEKENESQVRSPGEGNGNSLQYSCLENPMDRGDWQATVHGVLKGWTQLSN